jgi:glycine/D-amino acid oxidase-like deaminating enzyme
MMPDMMPRVGRGRRANVFYNTGHGHLGWTLSAGTADMVADLVHGQTLDRRSAVRPAAPVQAAA